MNAPHCIATLLTCATLAFVACSGGQESETLVRTVPAVRATSKPVWDAPGIEEARSRQKASEVAIHLDVSRPMGGFLPPTSAGGNLSALHVTVQNLSQHMVRVYGGADVAVQRYGVGHELRELDASQRIQRELFNGQSTQLDLSIDKIVSDLRSGYSDAAAIVSDLMATGDITGPLLVSTKLSEWLESDDVRSGEFHVGLFGVKARYWGVMGLDQCPSSARLGCWYDERLQRYRPLESVADFPLYVLVLGRRLEHVTAIMESLQQGIDEMDQSLEVQWELLTSASCSFETSLTCEAAIRGDGNERERQYALVVNRNGQYGCQRDSTVTLYCGFAEGDDSFLPTDGRAAWIKTAEDAPDAKPQDAREGNVPAEAAIRVGPTGSRIEVDVDCAAIRNARADVKLALDIAGRATRPTKDWGDWSTEVAALGKTLNLEGFVESVRLEPDSYRVRLPAFLHFPGG